MSWVATLPIILACAALLFAPGFAVSTALGLRGLPAWAGAPVITVALASPTAMLAAKLGAPWSVIPLLAVVVVLSAIFWLLRKAMNNRSGYETAPWTFKFVWGNLGQLVGFAAGAAIIANQLRRVFGSPLNISQTFDNIFHLNAVRYMLDTGNASSLMIGQMTNPGATPEFYPAAWHGMVALLVQLTGTPLSAAANMFNLVIAALVWVLGCMFLVRTVVGPKPWVIGFSALLSASFTAFPLLLLDFGVLYPNFLAIALLPFSLGAVAVFFGLAAKPAWHPLARYAIAPLAAIGVALSHPNGGMTLVALAIPVVLVSYIRRYWVLGLWKSRRIEAAAATIALVLAAFLVDKIWQMLRPPASASTWEPFNRPSASVGEILTNSAMHRPMALIVSVLMMVGIYAAFRTRRHFWVLGCFAVTAYLYLVVSSFNLGEFRTLITGVWYNDSYRLAAILPVSALPLAAVGFGFLWDKVSELAPKQPIIARIRQAVKPQTGTVLGAAAGVLAIVLLTIGMQGFTMTYQISSAAGNYRESPKAPLVSTDELTLINKLGVLVPPNDVIATSPWTGASMAFALGDRFTTSKHTFDTTSPDIQIINDYLRDAETNPEVCPAVKRTGVRFALDFGTQEVHNGRHLYPGLDDLADSPAFELVAQVGDAKLFKLNAC